MSRHLQQRTQELQEANAALKRANVQFQAEAAERRQLLQRLVTAQEDERTRVARELHDHMSQNLAAIKMWLYSLPDFPDPGMSGPNPNKVLSSLEEQVSLMMDTAQRLAWELRPPVLENIGLAAALEQYAYQWAKNSSVEATVVCQRKVPAHLSPEAETCLYRVAQEALTNVARHAQATEVSLVLSATPAEQGTGQEVRLVIEDNGRGFDTEQSTNRLGLLGMHERVALAEGTLVVESEPGHGTTLYLRLPLPSPAPPQV